jgi:starvation-inducible DNA-binding protein
MKKLSVITRKPVSHYVYVTPKVETTEMKIESVTLLLSALLSNEISLYIKTRRFDWNVLIENDIELHKTF